jgi:peptidoglycan hydrolase-like protein with peptidoglycan-binding domain
VAATAAAAGIATPAQATGSFCDIAKSTYTGGYNNANIIMPASSGPDGISCSMSRGATGSGVYALQQSLNRCYGESLSLDGQFGPRTQAALTRAQQRHGHAGNPGRYTDDEAYYLKFMGVRGLRLVCARIDSAVLQ